ncbi:MAG: hypothetical protein WDN49_17935 [Acetobacteraceae bacterium]
MFQSHVIEVNGTFIGAAVTAADGFRFRAVHPRVEELDGRVWYTLVELRRATGHLFVTGRLSPGLAPAQQGSAAAWQGRA